MVRPLPRRLPGARAHLGGAEPEARQGEHRREPDPRGAVRDPVDPEHDPLRERAAEGERRRRHAEGDAREAAGARRVAKGTKASLATPTMGGRAGMTARPIDSALGVALEEHEE